MEKSFSNSLNTELLNQADFSQVCAEGRPIPERIWAEKGIIVIRRRIIRGSMRIGRGGSVLTGFELLLERLNYFPIHFCSLGS
jgi:hypothetical protein